MDFARTRYSKVLWPFCGNLFSQNLGVREPVTSCVDSDQTVPSRELSNLDLHIKPDLSDHPFR